MADNWMQNVACRYFNNGGCREGNNCPYQHVQETSNEPVATSTRNEPMAKSTRNQPVAASIRNQPVTTSTRNQPVAASTRNQPVATSTRNEPVAASTRNQPVATSTRNQPVATSTRNEPVATSTNAPFYITNCRYFQQGTCRFGNTCYFLHIGTENEATKTNAIDHFASSQSMRNNYRKADKRNAEEWVKAPEFIPTAMHPVAGSSTNGTSMSGTSTSTSMPISYAQAVNPSGQASNPALEPLCPYAEASGLCRNINCTYLHGDICELCSQAVLHPYNEELRKKHTNACVKQHEADMELSFAIQRSKEKSCGVCFETIMEKDSREQRFGILPNCNHCFCLSCIRKWRQAKQFDNKIIRACPECRTPSDFVCPSIYWVDTKEEKEKLIKDYKDALSTKDCKYFNKGRGKCPFGNKCFYLHALPDGTKKDVGPPVRQRRSTTDPDMDLLHQLILWDFLDERDDRWMYLDLEDIPFFSDTDDSDWSDYELSFD